MTPSRAKNGLVSILLSLIAIGVCGAEVKAPASIGPVFSENQMRWQNMEYYAFIHFSLNTYTDLSWGFGNENINLFNLTNLDAREWVRVYMEAGMTGVINPPADLPARVSWIVALPWTAMSGVDAIQNQLQYRSSALSIQQKAGRFFD